MRETPPELAPDALAELQAYSWPGNIRELRNMMERALLLAGQGTITAAHLPTEKTRRHSRTAAAAVEVTAPPEPRSISEIEKQAIIDALVRCGGNQSRAAELLGMPRRTFCKRLRDYNIPRPRA
jgi:two-component system, NtrC family, response regulator AtoC